MNQLSRDFRAKLKELVRAAAWEVVKSTYDGVLCRRRPTPAVVQEISIRADSRYQPEADLHHPTVQCWMDVIFEPMEAQISELIARAGHDIHITDRRTASFSIRSVQANQDPDCITGFPLEISSPPEQQATAFWEFVRLRAMPILDQLGDPACLAVDDYLPPFTSTVAWGTRRMYWHALAGRGARAREIAAYIGTIAPIELTASAKALQRLAGDRGHTFLASPRAFDYSSHPRWLEFTAVRDQAMRVS